MTDRVWVKVAIEGSKWNLDVISIVPIPVNVHDLKKAILVAASIELAPCDATMLQPNWIRVSSHFLVAFGRITDCVSWLRRRGCCRFRLCVHTLHWPGLSRSGDLTRECW
jgi:hypothetical protein